MNSEVKRGEKVFFNWGHRWVEGKLLQVYPEFHEAIKVEKDECEYILKGVDVRSWSEHQEAKSREKWARFRIKYRAVVELWESGVKDRDAMAQKLVISPRRAAAMLALCKKRGLIK